MKREEILEKAYISVKLPGLTEAELKGPGQNTDQCSFGKCRK